MLKKSSLSLLILTLLLASALASVAMAAQVPAVTPRQTVVQWHGHAAFEITTPLGKVFFIDPWLSNPLNPAASGGKNPVEAVKKADYILLTHGHSDHVGDAIALGTKTGARLVAGYELGTNLAKVSGYPANQMGGDTLFNIGGEITVADGEVTIAMTPAVHSSGLETKDGTLIYGGSPCGFVLKIKNGPTIYHSGDTAYFRDMELIGSQYAPDLALLNIGGHFGMEPREAATAASKIHARWVVPHHYKTFPILTQDAGDFAKRVAALQMTPKVMTPGAILKFEGRKLLEK